MDTLIFGLTVTGIGIAIVFAGLVVLIGLIKTVSVLTGSSSKPKKEKKAEAPKPAAAPAPAPGAGQVSDEVMAVIAATVAAQDQELIAVISAAVAAMMGEGNGFTVRRIRRVSNASAWQKAGREEQIYSRF